MSAKAKHQACSCGCGEMSDECMSGRNLALAMESLGCSRVDDGGDSYCAEHHVGWLRDVNACARAERLVLAINAPCRLGYREYDRSRYCHEHGGFVHGGSESERCDVANQIEANHG